MLTYRFVSEQVQDGSFVRRPKINVALKGRTASMSFLALLDSGTDLTIIPRSIADFLGLEYDFKSHERFYGFSKEPFQCAHSEVDIIFQGKIQRQEERLTRVPVLVALSGEEKEPILGCAKIFDAFKISFIKGRKIQLTRMS